MRRFQYAHIAGTECCKSAVRDYCAGGRSYSASVKTSARDASGEKSEVSGTASQR